MTLLRRGVRAGGRVLDRSEYDDAIAICALDPVASVLAAARITAQANAHGRLGEVWGYGRPGELTAVCWSGANLVPVNASAPALAGFAELAGSRGKRCSSISGDAAGVLGLWRRLEDEWPLPREIRGCQPSMVLAGPAACPPDPWLRRARLDEIDIVLPAAIAMFVEEVGYAPASGDGYRGRLRELIDDGLVFIKTEASPSGPQVVFKCEIGARALGVAQIQGVWTHPGLRGRGIATACVAATVDIVRAEIAPIVSLYVNDYNAPAIHVYEKLGFERVGEYATVLF